MTVKKIFFETLARQQLLLGIVTLTNAVQVTLGPCGRNVVIERGFGAPIVTKDGVTVAKEIELKDRVQNMGAQLLREVASKTADVAGDGTTTATILAKNIIVEGSKYVTSGIDSIQLKRGIDDAVKFVVSKLKENSLECVDESSIAQVGTISANYDETIGKIIAEAMRRVGKDGVVTVENGNGLTDELVVVEGLQFDRGYISPYFANFKNNTICELENPVVFITDKKISSMRDLILILETVAKSGRSLFIIAEDVDGEALATLVINNVRGLIKVCVAKAPGFGDRRKDLLEDIAVLTNTIVFSDESGSSVQSVSFDLLGAAKKIICTKDDTTIIGVNNSTEAVATRLKQLQELKKSVTSEYDREKLQERIAKLSGGIGIIKIGAATEAEMNEKKYRVEDALHATRAAVEEGVLPGGGVAFVKISNLLKQLKCPNEDRQRGINVIANVLTSPLKQIVVNGGYEPSIVLKQLEENDNFNYGFDVTTGKYGDMVSFGILDPTKVARCALQNAASIACLLISTECAIVEYSDKHQKTKVAPSQMPYNEQFSDNSGNY